LLPKFISPPRVTSALFPLPFLGQLRELPQLADFEATVMFG
jgi:hypothetical protein